MTKRTDDQGGERMAAMHKRNTLLEDTKGYAVVEATILFPFIIMVFAGIVLLSVYLPTRGTLQYATQYAATALATELSDDWLFFDEDFLEYYSPNVWVIQPSVYQNLLAPTVEDGKAKTIVENIEKTAFTAKGEGLEVECTFKNYVVYAEITVTATRTFQSPVNLSFVGFPSEIPVVVSSTAVVQNGDEFVRNIDLAAQFIDYLKEKYDLTFLDQLGETVRKVAEFFGV